MGILNILQALGPILSNMAAQRAAGKATEAGLTQQQNQGATSRYQALVNAGRLQNIEQPAANLQQATRGSALSSWKPVSVGATSVPYGQNVSGPIKPTITGGPSMTPELQQLGSQVTRDALSRQLGGNKLDTGTFPSDADLGLGALPESGVLDKILGVGSTAASLLGALAKPAAGAIPGGTAAGAVGSATAPLASTPISGYAALPGAAGAVPSVIAPLVSSPISGVASMPAANPGNMTFLQKLTSIFGGSGTGSPRATGLSQQEIDLIKQFQKNELEKETNPNIPYGGW